ncbi:MAG: AMP-binding protein, partial [Bacteroidota bacterium]
HVTYGALVARAERLASGLATAPQAAALSAAAPLAEARQTAAPLAETVVGVAGARSPELFAALLGVWCAGGAYVPLSLEDPAARWAEQVRDAGVQTVLASAGSLPAVAERVPSGVTVLSIEDLLGVSTPAAESTPDGAAVPEAVSEAVADGAAVAATWLADEAATDPAARARRLAYVLFTSGSTGRPKGAMVEQRGLVNHLLAKVDALALGPTAVVAQTARLSFDISIWQGFAALVAGGRTEVVATAVVQEGLAARVERSGTTVLEVVPSLLGVLLEAVRLEGGALAGPVGRGLSGLRWLLSTGEGLPQALAQRWSAVVDAWEAAGLSRVGLLNAYGPTECSDDVTHEVVGDAERQA